MIKTKIKRNFTGILSDLYKARAFSRFLVFGTKVISNP